MLYCGRRNDLESTVDSGLAEARPIPFFCSIFKDRHRLALETREALVSAATSRWRRASCPGNLKSPGRAVKEAIAWTGSSWVELAFAGALGMPDGLARHVLTGAPRVGRAVRRGVSPPGRQRIYGPPQDPSSRRSTFLDPSGCSEGCLPAPARALPVGSLRPPPT